MATIFAATSLDLTEEQRDSLADALINDLGTIYKHALSFNLVQIPQDSCRGDSINQTTFFVCVPPYATLEKKRETIELLHNTMVRETGYQGELKNIVLFQYHDDDGGRKRRRAVRRHQGSQGPGLTQEAGQPGIRAVHTRGAVLNRQPHRKDDLERNFHVYHFRRNLHQP